MTTFWIVDSLLDIFRDDLFTTYFREPFLLANRETYLRVAILLVLCGYIAFFWKALQRRSNLQTELESVRTSAEQEKLRAEAIVGAMGDAISVQGMDYRILYQNKPHKELMGDHLGEHCYTAYQNRKTVCDGATFPSPSGMARFTAVKFPTPAAGRSPGPTSRRPPSTTPRGTSLPAWK
jgi:hypothetical protein